MRGEDQKRTKKNNRNNTYLSWGKETSITQRSFFMGLHPSRNRKERERERKTGPVSSVPPSRGLGSALFLCEVTRSIWQRTRHFPLGCFCVGRSFPFFLFFRSLFFPSTSSSSYFPFRRRQKGMKEGRQEPFTSSPGEIKRQNERPQSGCSTRRFIFLFLFFFGSFYSSLPFFLLLPLKRSLATRPACLHIKETPRMSWWLVARRWLAALINTTQKKDHRKQSETHQLRAKGPALFHGKIECTQPTKTRCDLVVLDEEKNTPPLGATCDWFWGFAWRKIFDWGSTVESHLEMNLDSKFDISHLFRWILVEHLLERKMSKSPTRYIVPFHAQMKARELKIFHRSQP